MEAVVQDRTTEARNLLVTALQALQQARQALEAQPPNDQNVLDYTLKALQAAFRGYF